MGLPAMATIGLEGTFHLPRTPMRKLELLIIVGSYEPSQRADLRFESPLKSCRFRTHAGQLAPFLGMNCGWVWAVLQSRLCGQRVRSPIKVFHNCGKNCGKLAISVIQACFWR